MQLYGKFLLLFLYFAGCSTTLGNKVFDNGTIVYADRKPSEFKSELKTTYDDEGLGPWYNLGNSFISTVLSKDPWPIAGKAINDGIKSLNIRDDVIEGYAIGMIVTVAIGVLFCLLMPIVGFCFCCCRCCGNCGGEMTQKDLPGNGCKRVAFGVILTIITLLMFSGVLLTFVCNDNMSKTLDKAKDTSSGIVSEMSNFINQTLSEFQSILKDDMPFTLDQLINDISDTRVEELLGKPFLKKIEDTVRKPIAVLQQLALNSTEMEKQLDVIVNNRKFLQEKAIDLADGLNNTKANVTIISDDCNSITPKPKVCDDVKPNDLAADADFTNLPDVNDQLDSVRKVTKQNFTKSAEKGLETVLEVPGTIINETRETRHDIRKMITNASTSFDKLLDDIWNSSNKVVLDPLKDMKNQVHEGVDYAKQYDRYRWYGGVGLTCILLLIVVLMALGLMCGVCGHDKHATPSSRGTVSNMGGNCLMAATGFCFMFASLLMLLTTICFIIGAPMQGVVCEPIQTGKLFSQFLDNTEYFKPLLMNKLLETNKTEIKIGESLDNCRANQPAYIALHLSAILNISERLNIKELMGDKVDAEFENLKVNFTDKEILSQDSRDSLSELESSGINNIDFKNFTDETRKEITKKNLTEVADTLVKLAQELENLNKTNFDNDTKAKIESMKSRARNTADELRKLDKDIAQEMERKANELDQNVVKLREIGGDLQVVANNVLEEAEKAEKSLHDSTDEILEIISKYKDRVLGYGYQFTAHVLYLVNNKLGRCKPLTNVFDAVVVLACKDFLMPFNGFWLAIGFCLFFFIPAIIFSVKLAKHYRRMSYESNFDDYNGPEMMEMGQPVGQEKKLWANPKGYANGARH